MLWLSSLVTALSKKDIARCKEILDFADASILALVTMRIEPDLFAHLLDTSLNVAECRNRYKNLYESVRVFGTADDIQALKNEYVDYQDKCSKIFSDAVTNGDTKLACTMLLQEPKLLAWLSVPVNPTLFLDIINLQSEELIIYLLITSLTFGTPETCGELAKVINKTCNGHVMTLVSALSTLDPVTCTRKISRENVKAYLGETWAPEFDDILANFKYIE